MFFFTTQESFLAQKENSSAARTCLQHLHDGLVKVHGRAGPDPCASPPHSQKTSTPLSDSGAPPLPPLHASQPGAAEANRTREAASKALHAHARDVPERETAAHSSVVASGPAHCVSGATSCSSPARASVLSTSFGTLLCGEFHDELRGEPRGARSCARARRI